ncbi:A-kinase anchor protein 10, mitochondrial-like [Mizuhopecten yessoensis]|uniref:A-kinase anchor protein 10, mitochondrial-like n=1 Tax=Mizuhopecten yessoensis TaxID=6573 RepID=UPI000B45BA27|nr:A-kinase anchor protein 10, mitochondrial-like [Mizuhopecten yessoensis]
MVAGNQSTGHKNRPAKLLLSPEDLQDTEDLGDCGTSLHSRMPNSSWLSKTLSEILNDKDALGLLIKYMDAIKSAQHIRFWLDAESFQASTWSRLRTHSLNSAKKSLSAGKVVDEIKVVSPIVAGEITSDEQVCMSQLSSRCSSQIGVNDECRNRRLSSGLESVNTESSHKRHGSDSELSCPQQIETEGQVSSPHLTQKDGQVPQSELSTGHDNLPRLGAVIGDSEGAERGETYSPGKGQTEPPCEAEEMDKQDSSTVISRSSSQEDGERKMKRGVSVEDIAEKLKRSIERDAVKIFQKYLSHDATDPIGAPDGLRNETIHTICREDGQVDPQCFSSCQDFVFKKMEKEFYQDFVVSEYYYMHQINLLTSTQVHLADVLYNEGALFYFMEYLEQEGGSHFLQFLLATDNFQQHLMSCGGQYDGMEAQRDAMVLYDKYFSLQATDPLGFDDKKRFEIEENICREEGPLPECFAKPRDIVHKTIEKAYFKAYLQSDVYYKYLSELVSTVETANYPPRQRKRTASDASSEHSSHSAGSESRSSKNTYLATDTSHLRHSMNKLDTAMNLDPGLLNPDLLWKRHSPKMSLGKVDTLGEFVSEFDPNPDQEKVKASGLFKRKKAKEKEQEDMALKIAQMIINDVTSVTQTIGALKNPQQDRDDGS